MTTVRITRHEPGMIIFLIDRSYSMAESIPGEQRSLAQAVADAVNDTLYNICLRCNIDPTEGPRPYFQIALIGYGKSAGADCQKVESAFAGTLCGREVVDSAELARNPVRIAERAGGARFDGATVRVPEWVEPQAGYGTPMGEAFFVAGRLAKEFCDTNPKSYPPIVLNITDGQPTDSPYTPPNGQPAPVDEWARRLATLGTEAGNLLFMNAFITAKPADPAWFPSSAAGLPPEGDLLFQISSVLPDRMAELARQQGKGAGPGARGLVVNASSGDLAAFLDIGTTPVDAHVGD